MRQPSGPLRLPQVRGEDLLCGLRADPQARTELRWQTGSHQVHAHQRHDRARVHERLLLSGGVHTLYGGSQTGSDQALYATAATAAAAAASAAHGGPGAGHTPAAAADQLQSAQGEHNVFELEAATHLLAHRVAVCARHSQLGDTSCGQALRRGAYTGRSVEQVPRSVAGGGGRAAQTVAASSDSRHWAAQPMAAG